MAAGHGRDVGDMRRAAHGRHGRLDVARLKLGGGMGVEHLAEVLRSRPSSLPLALHLRLDHVPDHGGDVGSAELRRSA